MHFFHFLEILETSPCLVSSQPDLQGAPRLPVSESPPEAMPASLTLNALQERHTYAHAQYVEEELRGTEVAREVSVKGLMMY